MARSQKKSRSTPTLDLHGLRVDQVVDAVDRFITKSNRAGVARVHVMTGKGSGKVQAETIRYMKLGGFPWEFLVMENGERNRGVLVVFLD